VLELQSQINDLKAANETLLTRVVDLETQNETLQVDLANANAAISALQGQLTAALTDIGENTDGITELQADVIEQKQLTSYMSVDLGEHSVYFKGANVYVQSGSGFTNGAPNGLGNLIIGYNEIRPGGNVRSGSHNLVVGSENNFSSFGGLVVGDHNEISAMYAVTIDSDSDINISGINVNLTSAAVIDLFSSGSMELSSVGPMDLSATLIFLNGPGEPAARVGDMTTGTLGVTYIVTGSPTVLIGGGFN